MPLGIPHSAFLGWDSDDQDKALAWQSLQARACPSCRTRPEEWDPEAGGDRNAWEVEETYCPGCARMQLAQAGLDPKDEENRGVHLRLTRPKPHEH